MLYMKTAKPSDSVTAQWDVNRIWRVEEASREERAQLISKSGRGRGQQRNRRFYHAEKEVGKKNSKWQGIQGTQLWTKSEFGSAR